MSDIITCPYCGARMEFRELGHVKKVMFYECPKCLACSPQTVNKVAANSMARMRGKNKVRKEPETVLFARYGGGMQCV